MIEKYPFFTSKEVAEKSGKSLEWVMQCLRSGKLQSTKIGRQYIVTQEQYDQWFRTTTLSRGRPKRGKT